MKTFHIVCCFVFLIAAIIHTANCMQCELGGNRDFIDKINFIEPKECPSLIDGRDKEFCCLDDSDHFYCCTGQQFFFNKFGIMVIIGACLIVGFLLSCCLCCFCCPCCCWYKRRHGGIVYATMPHTTSMQTVVMTSPPMQQYPSNTTPGFSASPGTQQAYPGQDPPPYSFKADDQS